MSKRLDGSVAVVTGGGKGIGEAVCLRFAEEGANVVAVDKDRHAAEDTVEQIREQDHPEATAVACDVSEEAEVRSMAAAVAERHDAVDVLVNNAGVRVSPKPVTEADEESWDRVIGVNQKGVALCSKHVIPLMTEGGAVVNNASVGAQSARPNWSQYDSTKGAVLAMTKDMACDHADDGIRVNAVSPGWVITDYHIGDRTGEEAERFVEEKTAPGGAEGSILRRAAKPREIADAVLWLASDESSFVTGVNVPVDGGASVLKPGEL